MAYSVIICTLAILIAGSHQTANLVVDNDLTPGYPVCTVEQSSWDMILQYGVSYSKSFASMAKGQLLAVEYQGDYVKCCWVEEAKIDKSSLTPCDTPAPKIPAPTTTTPAPTTTTPAPTTTTPAPTTTTPAPTTTTPAPTTTTPAPYHSCPAGFTKDGHYCFYFSTAKKEWTDALKACIRKNSKATLARPYTKEINTFIYNKIRRSGETYWFDLNDRSSEKHFKYTNGKAPKFTNWQKKEPNNGPWYRSEDCGAYDEGDDHKWNDRTCSNDHRYVCQMDAIFHQG